MIVVCSLKDLDLVCDSIKPSHIISVIDPGLVPKTPKGVNSHLKLGFDNSGSRITYYDYGNLDDK